MNILNLTTYIKKSNLSFPQYQLHELINKCGYNSVIVAACGDIEEENIIILRNKRFSIFGLSRLARKVLFDILLLGSKFYYYPEWNLDFIFKKEILRKLRFKPDVIIVYWSKFAFTFKNVSKLSRKIGVPVIYNMMDMAPLTGGCHYSMGCDRYYKKCGNCPALKSRWEYDLSRVTWEKKKKYIDRMNISLLVGTQNQLDEARNSSLFKNIPIEILMANVDEDIFFKGRKTEARIRLGLPKESKIIFFGAASLNLERKGIKYLIEALKKLYNKQINEQLNESIVVLIAGNNLKEIDIPYKVKYLGYLESQELLAAAYQASDCFVSASLEDSGPLMVNQAIMCGCPVISFDIGVAHELVINNITGYCATLRDSEDLAKGIESVLMLDEIGWEKISTNCREIALKNYSKKVEVEKIKEILDRIKNSKKI